MFELLRLLEPKGLKGSSKKSRRVWVRVQKELNFSQNIHSLDFFHQRCICTL